VVPHPRIVSLVPSVTETLLAWGMTPEACTRFCEQPQLPHVGGTKDPDVEAVVSLRPDLVVMDAEENRREDHDALVAAGVTVHALRVRSVADVDAQLAELARRVGAAWTPVDIPVAEPAVTAFVPIWRRPWMALGAPAYGTSLLAAVGVANVYTEADGAYPTVTLEGAHDRGPDLVVAPSEPYPFAERHRHELDTVAPTVFVDGRDLFWWGARTPGAAARLRDALSRGRGGPGGRSPGPLSQ
jgi:ABC-type Fe3+-hydroxamate transport system substrate-binding protein